MGRDINNILEGLSLVRESKYPIVEPNEDRSKPDGLKKGDTIKVLVDINDKFQKGTLWRCSVVEGEPYKDETYKDSKYKYSIYNKLNAKTGKETESKNRFSFTGFEITTKDKMKNHISRGIVRVLTPGKPVNYGEVTAEDIKSVLKGLGLDRVYGENINKLIEDRVRYSYIIISYSLIADKVEKSMAKIYFSKLLRALDNKNWGYGYSNLGYSTSTKELNVDGYANYIGIKKIND